jgi:hypothetical protein
MQDPFRSTYPIVKLIKLTYERERIMKPKTSNEMSKQEWIVLYTERILKYWRGFKSPFEISKSYIDEIQIQLSNFYEIPEERLFIEMSY